MGSPTPPLIPFWLQISEAVQPMFSHWLINMASIINVRWHTSTMSYYSEKRGNDTNGTATLMEISSCHQWASVQVLVTAASVAFRAQLKLCLMAISHQLKSYITHDIHGMPVFALSPAIPLRFYTLPYWSNPLFLIFNIWALWRSGLSARAPKCQKLRIVG